MNNNENIKDICKEYGIINYTINDDLTIDVNGNVYLSRIGLTKLPLKFNKVIGYFYCSYNQLTSLDGCPKEVGGDFDCSSNNLTSLEGSPKEVGGYFSCSRNNLTSLEGSPKEVGGYFNCHLNPLPQEVIYNPKEEIKRLNREKKLNILLNED